MMNVIIFKLLAVLFVIYVRQTSATSETCYILNNPYTELSDYKLESIYAKWPFLKPLYNQAPLCPAENYKDCTNHIRYRTADGSCNNLKYKWWGSRFSPYQRILEPFYTLKDKEFVPRLFTEAYQPLPDVRLVANRIPFEPVLAGLNAWFTFFGQIIAHDLAHTPNQGYDTCKCFDKNPECFNIKITEKNEDEIEDCRGSGDCEIDPNYQECIPFSRSADVKTAFNCSFKNREQFTKGTHFLDLDILYGSSDQGQVLMRSYINGELKYDIIKKYETEVTSLPIADINNCLKTVSSSGAFWKSRGCVYANDDERVGDNSFLTTATLLFLRSHNEIAKGLHQVNPHWTDEIIFQEARRVLIAIYQNIVYGEYLELLLGESTMINFGLSPLKSDYSYSYDDYIYPNNYNEFIAAGFRLHHTVHKDIVFLNSKFKQTNVEIAGSSENDLDVHLMNLNNWLYYDKISTLMISFLGEGTYQSNFNMISGLNHKLPLNEDNSDLRRFSLGSANIQRGRDHGIPPYGYYRRLAGKNFGSNWEEVEKDFHKDVVDNLAELYDTPADIDLWVGLIAEKPNRDHLLPPTQSWIVGKNFFNLKYGDRFYYENGHDHRNRFTPQQLESIRNFHFSSLLCMGFQKITEYNMMPQFGFFMPNELIEDLVYNNEIIEYEGMSSCENGNKRPKNNIVTCNSLPNLDFSAWKDIRSSY